MNNRPPITLRSMLLSDEAFVIDSWMKSYLKNKTCTKSIYDKEQRKIIHKIIEKPQVIVQIICLEQDYDHIIGFICYESPNILHYVYVKSPFRGIGIAKYSIRELMSFDKLITTHDTPKFKPNGIIINHNPYLLYRY